MALRWGILGTGLISHDFHAGFTTLPPEEHKLVGVAARNIETAKKFAVDHSIEKAYGSYEELLQDNVIGEFSRFCIFLPCAGVCLLDIIVITLQILFTLGRSRQNITLWRSCPYSMGSTFYVRSRCV